MKKFLRGAFGLVALGMAAPAVMGMAAPAVAADLPVGYSPAPAMIPAWYDWSGLYIGANGGWGSSRNCWDQTSGSGGSVIGSEGCNNAKGAIAGGQIGHRIQFGSWLFGIEGSGNWADLNGSNVSQFPLALIPEVNRTRVDGFGLLTGQIGYAVDTVLLYAKGGGAIVGIRYNGFVPSIGPGAVDSAGTIRWGPTAGAGLEFAFALNWSLALEYDHIFLGTRAEDMNSNTNTTPSVFTREDRIRQDIDTFTVRLNYRLLGPVISKY